MRPWTPSCGRKITGGAFIEFWPDDKIGDASLVLDVDKDDAFAEPAFAHEHQAGDFKPASSRACMASAPASSQSSVGILQATRR